MPKGILGFRRLTSVGPFSYSSRIDGTEDVEEIISDIFDEKDIEEGDELSQEEFIEVNEEMISRIYPNGGKTFRLGPREVTEEQIFRQCIESRWADVWEEGFTQSTTGETGFLEEFIIKANGCSGIAEAGPAGIRVLALTEQ